MPIQSEIGETFTFYFKEVLLRLQCQAKVTVHYDKEAITVKLPYKQTPMI